MCGARVRPKQFRYRFSAEITVCGELFLSPCRLGCGGHFFLQAAKKIEQKLENGPSKCTKSRPKNIVRHFGLGIDWNRSKISVLVLVSTEMKSGFFSHFRYRPKWKTSFQPYPNCALCKDPLYFLMYKKYLTFKIRELVNSVIGVYKTLPFKNGAIIGHTNFPASFDVSLDSKFVQALIIGIKFSSWFSSSISSLSAPFLPMSVGKPRKSIFYTVILLHLWKKIMFYNESLVWKVDLCIISLVSLMRDEGQWLNVFVRHI